MSRKNRKPKLSAEDIALFRREAGPVSPMRPGNRAVLDAQRTSPVQAPRHTGRDRSHEAEEFFDEIVDPEPSVPGDELSFLRPGVQRTQLRKMRRGAYAIRSELDLHGMTVAEARKQLALFLHECLQNEERCVRIIHGKGRHSRERQPVLKVKLNHWLRQSRRVLAFCPASPADGGTGALYVLLAAN